MATQTTRSRLRPHPPASWAPAETDTGGSPPSHAGRHYVICNWRDSAHPKAGGAELYCTEVARHLARRGATVTYLTSRPPGAPATDRAEFGRIVRLGGTFTTYAAGLLWLWRHRAEIDGVIDSENGVPYFAPLAVSRTTPVVLVMHHVHQEQFAMYYPPAVATFGRLAERFGIRWVYRRRPMAAVSPSTRVQVRRQLGFRGPIWIVPNGLGAPAADHRISRSLEPTIVCVGRLVTHKRFDLLLEAMPRLLERWPDLRAHVVGDGDRREALARAAAARGLADRFVVHGWLGEQERDALLSSAWLTVSPTVGEGWGLSVLEAAAHGVPAVAFDVPGMHDSIRPGSTGWLVRAGDSLPGVIDEALRTLSQPERAAAWAERCRRWAQSFPWESTGDRLLALLESERDRLRGGIPERRGHSDMGTVVVLEEADVDEAAVRRLRRTDQLIRGRNGLVTVLLAGADERDAWRALERVGLAAPVEARVARRSDLFGGSVRDAFRIPSRPVPGRGPDPSAGRVVDLRDAAQRRSAGASEGPEPASRRRR